MNSEYRAESLELEFNVGMKPEPGEPTVVVQSRGAPPQMFRVGIGVVVEGVYDGKVFRADRVIVKHSNEYKPPDGKTKPGDMSRTLIDES